MTTYEEDVVDVYYNLKGYFTIKNIPFSAIEKRPGGKGRGEIDLLAIKIEEGKVKDAIHVEISVSITSPFPFKSETKPNIDESNKLIKKFFLTDADYKIKEYLPSISYREQFITSYFNSKSDDRLKERLKRFGAKVVSFRKEKEKRIITLSYNGKEKTIEIIPFPEILRELVDLFKEKDLMTKNFQDSRVRAIQYLVKNYK